MDTSISEETMASLKRTNEIRMAKMCRLCLQETSLQNINVDLKFKQVLTESTSKFLPNDRNFPQFVCASCRKMVNLLHKFNQRREHSARLIRSYMAHGGSYPEAKLLDEKQQQERPKKRSAPSEKVELKGKDSKKTCMARDENDNNVKSEGGLSKVSKSEKHGTKSKQKDQHRSKGTSNDGKDKSVKSNASSKKKQSNEKMLSVS